MKFKTTKQKAINTVKALMVLEVLAEAERGHAE
jgi:hypothetical protein